MDAPDSEEKPTIVSTEAKPETVVTENAGTSLARADSEAPGAVNENWTTLQFTWAGKPFTLEVADSDRVLDLKSALHNLTCVPPSRQKILGLVKGKLPDDAGKISDLKLAPGKKFTLVGTPEGDEIKDPNQLENFPDITNDLDFDPSALPRTSEESEKRNQRKVREHTERLKINVMHPFREGKKLLVLDIDYTILDTKPLTSGTLPPSDCARPGLHEFLEHVYQWYDICIWSQTSWVWLETKLVELGMVGAGRRYEISFVLDKTSMFQVFSKRPDTKGEWQHSVKALQIIWNHFPQFNARNTVHLDDLSRNFALNPTCGMKIPAFKNAHLPEAQADRELAKAARYLGWLAGQSDAIWERGHREWKNLVRGMPPQTLG